MRTFELIFCEPSFFSIHPPPELLPVLGPLEWYMSPTLDAALLNSSRAGSDLSQMLDRFEELCQLESCSASSNWNCNKVFPLLNY